MRVAVLALLFTVLFGTLTSSAFSSYDTYTYSIDGEPMKSPAAYSASQLIDSPTMGLLGFPGLRQATVKTEDGKLYVDDNTVTGGKRYLNPADITTDKDGNQYIAASYRLLGASDIVTDEEGSVYIADTGGKSGDVAYSGRIVVLNKYYKVTKILTDYVDENGVSQVFNEPAGVYVTDPTITADGKSYIYVCDTQYSRIVVFDREYNYVRTIGTPATALLSDTTFRPSAVAVDKYGRIFVLSKNCEDGVIVLSGEGDFTGFIGAQKVTYSVLQMIWRHFQTKEQLAQQALTLPAVYNNLTVDSDGFVYVTNNKIDSSKQIDAIKSKNADYSPVKKLNSAGNEIMKRNGFFDPGGEVAISTVRGQPSSIIDVAVGPEGSWSLLEESKPTSLKKRSRIFTYDQSGNLLFAFGDKGDQLGNGENYIGFTYQKVDGVTYMLLLDKSSEDDYKITVFTPTDYCDTIMKALRNQNEHNYSASITYWEDVLKRNNNFDLAYIGIGKALYNQGKYEEAKEMLANAYETTYYSRAFSELRKDVVGRWLVPLLILVIALVVLLVKFLAWAKKKNKAVSLKVGRKTYGEELLYLFHLNLHPFDGFWDLKHEQRGSVRAATTILGATILAFFYQSVGRGYVFNPKGDYSTIFVQIIAVTVPVLLWSIANWCLTTLFDGEGSFKDIYVATCYSLSPLPFMLILSTILSNVLTTSEGSIVSLLVSIAYVWVALLLFFGMLVTHDYSLGKNFLITIFTIVAMAVIMFVAILFSSLVIKMVTFVMAIITEVGNRV